MRPLLSLSLLLSFAFSTAFFLGPARFASSSTRQNAVIGKSTDELMREFVSPQKEDIKNAFKNNSTYTVGKDDKGYEVKAKEWFGGLSSDPGDSLSDPRVRKYDNRSFSFLMYSNSGLSLGCATTS